MNDTPHAGTPIDVATTLYAVVRHMKDYSLPAPVSVDVTDGIVSVFVLARCIEPWLDAMIVDRETTEPCALDSALVNHERALFRGRIVSAANGAVGFELRTVRPATTTLRAVPA